MKHSSKLIALLLSVLLSLSLLTACDGTQVESSATGEHVSETAQPANADDTALPQTADAGFSLAEVPSYDGAAYVAVHDNVPYFTAADLTTESFESYASLDGYGRCGVAFACVGQDLMPTEDRGSIGQVKPSGWHTVKYDNVDGKYLYNRCHLIGYQLTGENANQQNLITGTRALNMEGMLPFENMVADYVKETGNHVLYRVTPIFEGANLVASGVLMEGYSVEDEGEGICYCVYAYNAQPGITIDYASGDSWETTADEVNSGNSNAPAVEQTQTYVLNTNSKKFHKPDCSSVAQMKNPQEVNATRQSLIDQGYSPCGNCNP